MPRFYPGSTVFSSFSGFLRGTALLLLFPALLLAPGCSKSSSPAPGARKITLKGQVAKQMAVKSAAVKYLEAGEPAKVLVLRTLGNYDVADIAADGTFAVQTAVEPCGLAFIDVNEDVVGTLFLAGDLGVLPLQTVDETTSEIDLAAITIDPYGEGTASHDPTLPGGETELTATERALMKQHGAMFVCCLKNLDMDGDGLIDVLHGQRYNFKFEFGYDAGDVSDQPKRALYNHPVINLDFDDKSDIPASTPVLLCTPGRLSGGTIVSLIDIPSPSFNKIIDDYPERPGVPEPGDYVVVAADRTVTLKDFPTLDPNMFLLADNLRFSFDQAGVVGFSFTLRTQGISLDSSKLVKDVWIHWPWGGRGGFDPTCNHDGDDWLYSFNSYSTEDPQWYKSWQIVCIDVFGNTFKIGLDLVQPTGTDIDVTTSESPVGSGVSEYYPPFRAFPNDGWQFSCWTGSLHSVREHDPELATSSCSTIAHFVPVNGWEPLGCSDRLGGVSRYSRASIFDNGLIRGNQGPSVAITSDGRPVISWMSEKFEKRKPTYEVDEESQYLDVCVRTWDGSKWVGFGTSDGRRGFTCTSPKIAPHLSLGGNWYATSLALDSNDMPIVAWSLMEWNDDQHEWNSNIYVAKWDGNDWSGLGCGFEGTGIYSDSCFFAPWATNTLLKLMLNSSGNPVVVWGNTVLTWDGSSWSNITGPYSEYKNGGCPYASLVKYGINGLAIDSTGALVAGWCSGGKAFVASFNGSTWDGLGCSLESGGGISDGSEISLETTPDGRIVVAWWNNVSEDICVSIWNGSAWGNIGASAQTNIFASMKHVAIRNLRIAMTDEYPVVSWIDDNNFAPSFYKQPDYFTLDPYFSGSKDGVLNICRWNGSKWTEVGPGSASGKGIGNTGGVGVMEAVVGQRSDGQPVLAWTEYSTYPYGKYPNYGQVSQVYFMQFNSAYSCTIQDGPPIANVYAPDRVGKDALAFSYGDLVPMTWTVTDIGGDSVSVSAEYSADGGVNWAQATIEMSTAGTVAGSGITGIPAFAAPRSRWWLVWDAGADGVGSSEPATVRFRLTPSDEEGAGTASETSEFTVDNTGTPGVRTARPFVAIDSWWQPTTIGGEVVVPCNIGDPAYKEDESLTVEFSDDGGSSWKPANVKNISKGLLVAPNLIQNLGFVATTVYFVWDTISDGIGLSNPSTGILLKITPTAARGQGIPVVYGGLTVDNVTLPSIVVVNTNEEAGNKTLIEFSFSDHRSSLLTVEFQYSTDGSTWSDANLGFLIGIQTTSWTPAWTDPCQMQMPWFYPGNTFLVSGNLLTDVFRNHASPVVRVAWDNGTQLGSAFAGNVKIRLRGIDPLLGAGPWAETPFFAVDNTQ